MQVKRDYISKYMPKQHAKIFIIIGEIFFFKVLAKLIPKNLILTNRI